MHIIHNKSTCQRNRSRYQNQPVHPCNPYDSLEGLNALNSRVSEVTNGTVSIPKNTSVNFIVKSAKIVDLVLYNRWKALELRIARIW